MTDQEEEFVHFVSCIESLNKAWRLINVIKGEIGNPLVSAAFQYVLIEYSKPYRESRSDSGKKRRLDTSCVPQARLALHKRLTDSRDQINAHSDLTVMNARLYVTETQGRRFSSIVQNIITGVEELKNLGEIQLLIEGTLENMYVKEKALEAALP